MIYFNLKITFIYSMIYFDMKINFIYSMILFDLKFNLIYSLILSDLKFNYYLIYLIFHNLKYNIFICNDAIFF